ncbi:CvfB family protein [Vagococcus intermedius]|uniref:S1-like domain-containing RNA-binding protein n=1 Tax=Vagococcus intermedius TaxID=2991418 RepID=A0AAF0CT28_9ENTE|nr:S1-like domain-containing RNA-binding protein [Vagococcus intermedius]WEG72425.1 S1-like domain-containing RNA-binding protein [Vagococcus intermedius]WEG74512.1 S1-like domain-containing RNA-binding protein [Vagococcus intermedius]
MQNLLGNVFTGLITDENEQAYFVQKEGVTFKLDKAEGEHELGEAIEGFAYVGQKQDNRFTTNIPKVTQDRCDFGEVVATRRDLGAFIDIGLPDKEVVLSLDELPTMRELWPKKGDRLMVSLINDNKDRMWATLADETVFQAMGKKVQAVYKEDFLNKDVVATAFRLKVAGTHVITEDNYLGFIHPSERYIEPRLGETQKGRIVGVSPDGTLNISLKPRAHEVISDDAMMILTFLEKSAEGKIPFTDKSTPEEIQTMFAISKGQFKRALGSLLKERRIKQEDGFTILLKGKDETTASKETN